MITTCTVYSEIAVDYLTFVSAPEDMDMENSDDEGESIPHHEEKRPSGARAAHEVTQPAPLPPTKQGNLVIRDFDPKKVRNSLHSL